MLYWLIQRENRFSQRATTKLKNALAELQLLQATWQQSEARFRSFMDNSPAASWITDTEGHVEYVSQTYMRMFRAPADFVGQTIFDVYPPDIAQIYLETIQAVARSQQVIEAIEPGIRPDGSMGEFLVYKFPLLQPDGSVQVGGVAIDVTERNRAEQELQSVHDSHNLALTAAEMGTWDLNLIDDTARRSLRHDQIFGYETLQPEWGQEVAKRHVFPADQPIFDESFQRARTTGELRFEVRIIWPDQSIHWINALGRVYYDEHQQPVRMAGVVMDITDRKQAEELLRLREQQFRQAIMNAPYPIILHAEDGEIVQLNQVWTELTGYEAADIPTVADWTEKAYGQRMETVRAGIDRLYALNERVHEGEFTPRTKDGQQRIWDFSSAPVGRLSDGRRLVLSMAADITARKQAEMDLRTALAEKEVLLKEIHHRVKNNLQIVSGLLQLQAQGLDDTRMVGALRESQNRVEAMSLIHKKLYTSSDLGQIDVADYIHSLATSILTTYQILPGRITLTVDVEPIVLSLDQAIPCGLIINELVSNALKYAFPNNCFGEINIKLCQINAHFELTIQDNGVGLPAHLNWHNIQSLGLSLVQALATDQLEGNLVVDHSQGAKFTITFPQE